ncbi:hypothetical protein [Vibrio parahaemolyticus]|uniref:hypothetical protein n=1 Tax=Vibrio parahaemolyticus TaxID=670 RepID=UPI00100EFC2C|nr:hypothetical protein [Vibrio parahaemolyticus]MDG2844655.1 hypothetical protein [Vibrio parahaemolyticus]MDG2865499.1 hypothetical protein [Vibrio parahaemolyticus]RXQ00896.1 hypothetical protein EGL69_22205 [Vibrio parahaemolyticus]
MKYWGYLTREQHLEAFNKEFPSLACPKTDQFFSVSRSDVIRRIIEESIPVGALDVSKASLNAIYDEYMAVSTEGMAWLLPAVCKYVLQRKPDHERFAEMIPLYIELGEIGYSFNLSFLNERQKELLYNLLEYLAETYSLDVRDAQIKLENKT